MNSDKQPSVVVLPDSRLAKGFMKLLGRMGNRLTTVLRQLSDSRAEEVQLGRFINNERLNPKLLVDYYHQELSCDVKGKDLLIVSDSSTISFNHRSDRTGLGFVGGLGKKKSGFHVHPAIVMDGKDGACYGLGGISIHNQPFKNASEKVSKVSSLKIPFDEKERYKWFDAPKQAIENYPAANSYTLVGDRESDIYNLIGLTLQQNWHFVYRNQFNRVLTTGKKLKSTIDEWKIKLNYELKLAATRKRSGHTAKMELKFGQVNIPQTESSRRTHHLPEEPLPKEIPIFVVEVKEHSSSVINNEKPVHWILLTSHPVTTAEQAMKIVKWYLWRWTIEQLFRVLKLKGLNVENSEVERFEALCNLTIMALLVAIQVMQLIQARDGTTEQKISCLFQLPEIQAIKTISSSLEGKTKALKNPFQVDSLAFATWTIARLGGWKGYKNKPPGPITIVNGLNRFFDILIGFKLAT
jgi:hypothetical protein